MSKKNSVKKVELDKNLVTKIDSLVDQIEPSNNIKKIDDDDIEKLDMPKENSNDLENNKDVNYDKTNSYDFKFDDERLSELDSLDTSFLEGRIKNSEEKDKRNKDKSKKKTNNNKKIKKLDFKLYDNIDYKNIFNTIGIILMLLAGGLLGFGICYNFYAKTQIVVKTKIITEEKKVVDDNYLFLGDSITYMYDLDKYFEGLPVVNSGIISNTTEDILSDMKNRAYQYNPSKVFLLIGTNDFVFSDTDESIENKIGRIIDGIQENRPLAKIYVESIYPVSTKAADKKIDLKLVANRNNKVIETTNKEIEKVAKQKNVTYIDMYSKLYDEDDEGLKLEYAKDGLHISEEGYKVITEELKKYIN